MAAAADVPGIYDVVINGQGYILANPVAPNLPFRTQRAKYGYSPTFVSRQNTSGGFGDNQQDFWLTVSQRDWSLGEDQRYLHVSDVQQQSRFYAGTNIDIAACVGCVGMGDASETLTPAAAVAAMAANPHNDLIYIATSTTLYTINAAGTITSLGAHGITGPTGIAFDAPGSNNVFVCSVLTGVRQYNGAWSAFDTTAPAETMVFANNTLYSTDGKKFYSYDTVGIPTAQFTFKSASGTATADSFKHKLLYFGGKILATRRYGFANSGGELWQYDGVGFSMLAAMPPNFEILDATVVMGIVVLAGRFNSAKGERPAVFYYANGTIGLLWQAEDWVASGSYGAVSLAPFRTGFVFTDEQRSVIRVYDLVTGSTSTIASYTPSATGSMLVAATTHIAQNSFNTTLSHWPKSGTTATTSTVVTSLIDFDSSLTKNFRGVIVDWDAATDGNGGSVDIAYSVGTVAPTTGFTNLQTGAVSGTEYKFSSVAGRSVAIQVTLNKGTSTRGPVLKRIYLRAAPIQQTFRNDEMILDCTGKDGANPVQLRNQNSHALDGAAMVANLRTVITTAAPVTVTDRFGTITVVPDVANIEIIEIRPEEYFVRFAFREV